MIIRSGFMWLNARKCNLCFKSTSYFNGRFLSSAPRAMAHENTGHLIDRYHPNSLLRCMKLELRWNTSLGSYQRRFYSSEADDQNAENKDEETRGARFRDEFSSKIVPWEKIPVSFGNFSYYIEGVAKSLVEYVPSHLKQNKFRKYGGISKCSDSTSRIQFLSIPGNQRFKSSMVKTQKTEDAIAYPKEFCEWLAGIVDGDGSIGVSKKRFASLEITMGLEDLRLLRYIQHTVGGGIKMRAGAKEYRYRLIHPDTVIKVMKCLNGHIRHSARLLQLHRACQFLEIPVIPPFPLSVNSNWFAGFFDADGTITISMKDGVPQLSISVTSKLIQDIEPYKVSFGGSVYFDSGHGYYQWSIQSRKEIMGMLYYFKANTFRSHKSARFYRIKDFYKLYDFEAFKPDSIHHKAWLVFLNKWNKPHKSPELKPAEDI